MSIFSISDKTYNNMALSQFKKRNYSQAIKYYDKALNKNPNNIDALNGKGASLYHLNNHSSALVYFDKVLDINPNHISALLIKGKITFNYKGKSNEALSYYNKILKINHNFFIALLEKGIILIKVHRFEEAIYCFNKILELSESSIIKNISSFCDYNTFLNLLYNNKGFALLRLKKFNECISCYNKALKIKPSDSSAFNNKIDAQIEKEIYENGDYIYITKFAKKYTNKYKSGPFQNLEKLMKSKGYKIPNKLLGQLIRKSFDDQVYISDYITFKNKILYNSPDNINDYLNNFTEIYDVNNEDKQIQYLEKLIKEQRLNLSGINISNYINNRKNDIELLNFENSLFDEDDDESISMDEIDELSGYEFEVFTKILFEKMGYESCNTKLSGDQGADLIIKKFGETTVVQAKRYNNKVTNKAVQEVVASIKYYNANKGAVITNNEFTDSAIELANSNNIQLIDRNKLCELVDNNPIEKTYLKKLS